MKYEHASYSLADYVLTLKVTSSALKSQLGLTSDTIQIGGQGQFLGEINVEMSTDQWKTEADSTGAWVHSKSYDQSGTIDLDLNQMSSAVMRFIGICEAYYSSTSIKDGFDITINKADDVSFAIFAEDCRIQKLAPQKFGDEAANQSWSFTSGRITYNK